MQIGFRVISFERHFKQWQLRKKKKKKQKRKESYDNLLGVVSKKWSFDFNRSEFVSLLPEDSFTPRRYFSFKKNRRDCTNVETVKNFIHEQIHPVILKIELLATCCVTFFPSVILLLLLLLLLFLLNFGTSGLNNRWNWHERLKSKNQEKSNYRQSNWSVSWLALRPEQWLWWGKGGGATALGEGGDEPPVRQAWRLANV